LNSLNETVVKPVHSFADKLIERIRAKQSITCVGIDPQIQFDSEKSPVPMYLLDECGGNANEAIYRFFKDIIEAVADLVPIFKPQIAFFEQFDAMQALKDLLTLIREKGALSIIDAKRNDIGNTSEAYAASIFKNIGADATTVNGYLGTDCIAPFLAYEGKGLFILVKTSNQSSSEFQDLFSMALESVSPDVGEIDAPEGKLVRNYIQMATLTRKWGDACVGEAGYSDIGAVVGATFPVQMKLVRDVLPNAFFLIPGYGAQGGTAADIVHGVNADGLGAIVNSSRGIDYAYQKDPEKFSPGQFAAAAHAAVEEMNADIAAALQESGKMAW